MAHYNNEKTISDFAEYRVAERHPVIELNGAQSLTNLRDEQHTSGSGAITDEDAEFRVRHTTAGDFARLASKKRGVYQPGSSLEVGIGVRLDTETISGDGVAYWGYFDMETDESNNNTKTIKNGFVFGLDSTGLFVEVIRNGSSEHKTRVGSFNQVRWPGISLTKGNIFQIDFTYYGYGLIKFQVVEGDTGDEQQIVRTIHTVRLSEKTSLTNSNLQIAALAKSSSTTGDFSVYVGGRQCSVVGKYLPRVRVNTGRREGQEIGGTFEPVMSFRKKADSRSIPTSLLGFSILTDNDLLIQIRLGADITGGTAPSYGDLNEQDASETSLELDTTADSINISSGVKIFEALIKGGDMANRSDVGTLIGLPVDLPDEGVFTLAAKNMGTTATIDAIVQMTESL